MSDASRDLYMSVGFEGASAIKGLEGLNKKADETKESIKGIGETASKIGATFETKMSGLDKGFKLWETNSGKFTTTLEKKQKRIELLKDKTSLLEKEISSVGSELSDTTKKYGVSTDAAQKLSNQLYDLKIQQAEYNNELKNLNSFDWNGLDKIGDKFTKIGGVMTAGVTTPIVGLGVAGTKTFIQLEDAFSGVEKTVDATDEQLTSLREKLNNLVTGKGIPVKVTEMYGIAEAAGQLGIQMDNIEGFSEVMAKLGTATNMTSGQAATDLARFANIVQMPQENFDRLGSTIVALGNNLATTESEITSMSLRLSGAGKQIGLHESQILGFAGALSSVGIEAEAGGSAFSKVMIGMQNSVMNMDDSLDIFAAVSGKSVEEFKQLFETDASGALVSFTEGLGNLQKDGFNTNEILEELGFSEVRVSDALRRAANSGDVFRNALSLGNKAWEENTALNEEAEKKYKKTASKIEVFKNKLTLLSEKIGSDLKDKFSGLLDVGTKIIDWLSNLDDGTRQTAITIGMMAASIGPAFLAIGMGIKAVRGIHNTITDLGKGIKMIKGAFSGGGKAIAFLTSPIGIAIVAIGALIAIGIVLYKNWDKISAWFKDKFPNAFEKVSSVIAGFKDFLSRNMENFQGIFSGFTDFIGGVFSGDWSKVLNGLGSVLSGVFNVMHSASSEALNKIFGLFETLIAPLQDKFPFVFNVLSGSLGIFKDTVFSVFGNIKQIFNGLIDFVTGVFTGDWDKAWQGVKDVFGGIFNTLGDLLKAPLNSTINLINSAIRGINDNIKIQLPDWIPLFGGKELGFSIPTIPMLAKGTDYHIGGPAIVGEKGPELVNLNKGATVTPADKTGKILGSLGYKNRAETSNNYRANKYSDDNSVSRSQKNSLTAKIDVIIQKIIIEGEMTPGKIESLKREIKTLFKEAWEDAWYELCLKHPNLTES